MNKLKIGEIAHQVVIENESKINLFNISGHNHLDYKINENASLTLNIFFIKGVDLKIDINLFENSKLNINVAFINYDKLNMHVNIKLNGNNITSNFYARGINKKGEVLITLNGEDKKNLDGNIINEYAKVINYSDEKNILIPNLLVNSYGIIANHGVSIGSFNDEKIFYLESKGINREDSLKLLEEGFILHNFENSEKEEIKKVLGGEI